MVTGLEGGRQLEPRRVAAAPAAFREPDEAGADAASRKPRRSFGGKGRTVFVLFPMLGLFLILLLYGWWKRR